MKVRLSDVAEVAGVHPATVSRALNVKTRSRLSTATVERVLRAAEDLKYTPDSMARGLAQGSSTSIGVLIGDITVPLFPPILRGIDDVTSEAGYTALILNTDNDPDREADRLRALRARSVEGLIVATATSDGGSDIYADVAPSVFVVRSPVESSASSVISDDAAGIHALVSHLVELGHTRIAHIAGPQNISTGVTRLRAYREALFEHGLDFDPGLVVEVEQLRHTDAELAFGTLLDQVKDFTAVIAFNDALAFGAYRALNSRGLDCPQDISVAGFSDIAGADLVAPPLTTVAVNHYEMGRQAARLVLDMVEQNARYQHRAIRLPVELVIRESTGPRSD